MGHGRGDGWSIFLANVRLDTALRCATLIYVPKGRKREGQEEGLVTRSVGGVMGGACSKCS